MRLIDADALIKQIQDIHCKGCDNYNLVRCRACWVDDAVSYLHEAPSIGGWISVKDRLPEATRPNRKDGLVTSDDVLVCFCKDNGKRSIVLDSYVERSVVIDFYVVKYGMWFSELTSEHLMVTHWMPLPELPKEEASASEEL